MRRILRIASREYVAAVKTKGFIIGLVLAPVLMGGGAIGLALLKGRIDLTDKRIAVIDRSGVVVDALIAAARQRDTNTVNDAKTGRKLQPAYLIEPVPPDDTDPQQQRVALSDRIRRGELHAFLEIGSETLHPGTNAELARVSYYAKNAALDDVRHWLNSPINHQLRKVRLAEVGIDESNVRDLNDWRQVESLGLFSVDPATGAVTDAPKRGEAEAVLIPFVMVLLMFMMAMIWVIFPVLKEPGGTFATWLSLFPPFTPPLMLARLSAPSGVPAWQAWVGLLGVLACAALAIWLGGRIFRMGILFQGKLPKFRQVLIWAIRG